MDWVDHIRRGLTAGLIATTAAIPAAVSGCGGSGSSGDADPATITPAGSFLYGDVTVRPSGTRKDDAQSVLSRLLNTSDPRPQLVNLVNRALGRSAKGVNYDKDIKPWLGRKLGVALTSLPSGASGGHPPLAIFADSRDDGAARSFIERTNSGTNHDYRGTSYRLDGTTAVGVVHHIVVDASEAIFRQVVDAASGGSSLASDARFAHSRQAASQGGQTLLDVVVDLAPLADSPQFTQNAQVNTLRKAVDLSQPLTISLDALPHGVALEFAAKPGARAANRSPTEATGLLSGLPAQSWLALALPHIGQSIRRGLDQLPAQLAPRLNAVLANLRRRSGLDVRGDVLPALGDTAIFASGTQVAGLANGSPNPDDVSFGLVTKPDSPGAARRTIARVRNLLRSRRVAAVTPAPGGFAVKARNSSGRPGLLVEQRGDRVAVGVGQRTEDALLGGAQGPTLASSPAFGAARQALGAGLSPSYVQFLLSFAPVLQLAQLSSSTQSPSYQRAAAYLKNLDYLGIGGGRRGDLTVGRVVLGLH